MFRTSLATAFSVSTKVRRLGTDVFSPANLQRTLRDLNDPKVVKRMFGDHEGESTSRQSAVLIPLCLHNNQPSILFNLRSNKLTRHKGYPCFPGGVADETDQDSTHTALRETQEELGIQPKDVKVIGTLPKFKMPKDNMEVTAVVADIGDIDSHELDINYDEVSVVFSRTIEELCEPCNIGDTSFRGAHPDIIYSTPVFLAGNYKIWGVTGMILHVLLGRLVPDIYKKPLRAVTLKKRYQDKTGTKSLK